ncbi:MAG: methylated-DNA--[protein]-cysteine S-methyltransferase [Bacteroidales bacterium]
MYIDYFISPIGIMKLSASENALCSITFVECIDSAIIHTNTLLQTCKTQLTAYFEGKRKEFDIPVCFHGTPFQKKVWNALSLVKYGNTCTYQDIAMAINNPKATRAVGTAIGNNPLAIIIPCHRILPKQGGTGNYHWGKHIKEALLNLENLHNIR